MKRKLLLPIIMGSILFLGGCSYGGQNNASVPAPVPGQTGQVQTRSAANAVVIQNFAFNPSSLTVKTGDTVTWLNHDGVTHSIKSATFNSGDLVTSDKFQFTFIDPGTYDYSCGIHPSMQGTIIVQ